jgi:hypothetical protein
MTETVRDSVLRAAAKRYSRTASGDTAWVWIAMAFSAYWLLFVVGAYSGRQELNDLGAVCVLATLVWTTLERLWVRLDDVAIACIVAACLPLVVSLFSHAGKHPDAIAKHVSLYLVMAVSRLLRLPVASASKIRRVFAAQILIILILSVMTDRGGIWDGGTRHSGLFANPNNLALIPFLLLLFIDRRRDPKILQAGAHIVVIAVLVWTGTSGAIMAYGIGLAASIYALLPRSSRLPVIAVAVLTGLTVAAFIGFGGEGIFPDTRLAKQILVMRTELKTVLSGREVAYYDQERVLGPGAASGVWRLVHWRRTVSTYLGGSSAEKLVGFGIGSSPDYLGKLPHNEYLRVLFEQGIVGLLLFLFAWTRTIVSAPRDIRYCGLILAIYSFSENNLDNFPFMALFILCLSATGPGPSLTRSQYSDFALNSRASLV